jgi:hypothetical protein
LTSRSIWKNQYFHYESASNFHNKLRDIFITDKFFKQLNCFQEVPVKDLVPSYPNRYDAIDWYIDELSVIIELHGKQHYQMQSFGSEDSYINQVKAFNNIKFRDNRKKTFLLNANYTYLEISYKDVKKLNPDYLKNLILNKG